MYDSYSDTVKKELIVKPEGFPIERVYSRMVCPKGKSAISLRIVF